MNKKEFLRILETALSDFNVDERKEILYDYEEHFRLGKESGKSEDELIEELGDPKDIANQYRVEKEILDKYELEGNCEKSEKIPIGVSIIAGIGLLFFNLIFILGPYIGIAATIIALFVSAIAIAIAGAAAAIFVVFAPLIPHTTVAPTLTATIGIILFSIGTVAMGLLFLIGMCYVVKYFCVGTAKYIKWNIKIVTR
ncbi:MAG: DUF1700 domain-containing protein [Bacillota bacterium]|nr:DUF1700 domain-containing protein [Bacillota bacterium]